jgi:hypothetical protein
MATIVGFDRLIVCHKCGPRGMATPQQMRYRDMSDTEGEEWAYCPKCQRDLARQGVKFYTLEQIQSFQARQRKREIKTLAAWIAR